jgi:hypothetical protein
MNFANPKRVWFFELEISFLVATLANRFLVVTSILAVDLTADRRKLEVVLGVSEGVLSGFVTARLGSPAISFFLDFVLRRPVHFTAI